MAAKRQTGSGEASGRLIDAHFGFVQELTNASSELQQRLRSLQLDYQSAALRASQSQQAEDVQQATQTWQELIQSSWTDEDVQTRTLAAYEAYVKAIGELLAAGDVDPATLCSIGQSMVTVASYASSMGAGVPGAENAGGGSAGDG